MNLKNLAHTWKYHLIVLVSVVLILITGAYIRNAISHEEKNESSVLSRLQTEVQQLRSALRRNELKTLEADIAELARPVLPRVVGIVSRDAAGAARPIVTLTDALSRPRRYSSADQVYGGSGLLLDGEGYILTASSVAASEGEYQITFDDGKQRSARLLATDTDEQLALLKLERVDDLPATAGLNAPAPPQTGGWLIRLGRGLIGGRPGLSLGLMTAIRQDVTGRDIYLMDVELAPELNGGPAIDPDGQIVGINVPDRKTIPVDRVIKAIEILKSRAAASPRSEIGIELQELTGEMKRSLAVETGALVTGVLPGGAAAKAGLQPMDVVVGVGDKPVDSAAALVSAIQANAAGARIKMTVSRQGAQKTIEVETAPPAAQDRTEPGAQENDFGISLLRDRDPDGVNVTGVRPGSRAWKLGLRAGDRILSVNDRPVRGFTEFQRMSAAIKPDQVQLWLVRRGDQSFCIAIGEGVKTL